MISDGAEPWPAPHRAHRRRMVRVNNLPFEIIRRAASPILALHLGRVRPAYLALRASSKLVFRVQASRGLHSE